MRRGGSSLSLAHQALALDRHFPGGHVDLKVNRLVWIGELTPSADSATYEVRVTYRMAQHPQVRVLSPKLDPGLAESLPHVFRHDDLCLYLDGEWKTSMSLAETVVPWASEWLFYYEIWKPTGEWYGGGDWPPVDRAKSPPMVGEQASTSGSTGDLEQGEESR